MFKMILKLFTNSKDMTRSERGATYVYVAILLPAFIGFIGLGVDVGLWQVTKRDTQIIADASAVAGALEVMRFQADPDGADTNQSALNGAIANGYDAASGLDGIVINDPPVSGPYAGRDGTVEVIMTRSAPIFFSSLFRSTPVLVRSRAVAAAGTGGNACIWALSPDEPSALKVTGNAVVDIDCGVQVNSSDEDALNVSGIGCIWATDVKVSGGDGSGGCINPEADTTDFLPYDPLSEIPEPAYDDSFCDTKQYNINSAHTFSPGCYKKPISISTDELVTFEPGLYIFDGAALNIGGSANVVGTGVMFYLNPFKTPDQVDILAGATVSLSAPTAASCAALAAVDEWPECTLYESILFFEAREPLVQKLQHKFGGGASMDLNGIMYFPDSEVLFQGGGETDNSSISIIAYMIDFVGTTNIGDFPTTIGEDGEIDISLPFNRFLIRVQLLE